jgi:hypothetical protein
MAMMLLPRSETEMGEELIGYSAGSPEDPQRPVYLVRYADRSIAYRVRIPISVDGNTETLITDYRTCPPLVLRIEAPTGAVQ